MDVYAIGDVIDNFLLNDDFYLIPNFDTYYIDPNYIEVRVFDNSYDDIRLMEDFENEFNKEFRGEWQLVVSGTEQRMDIVAQSHYDRR